jgi:homeobox protein cut-like
MLIRSSLNREQDLQRQVTLSTSQLRNLRTSNESTQARLLDASQRQDSETVAKLAEVDMITADLERANSRVATLERRNVSKTRFTSCCSTHAVNRSSYEQK